MQYVILPLTIYKGVSEHFFLRKSKPKWHKKFKFKHCVFEGITFVTEKGKYEDVS